jgi:hypothetical protein
MILAQVVKLASIFTAILVLKGIEALAGLGQAVFQG